MPMIQLNNFSPIRKYRSVFTPITQMFDAKNFYHIRGENGIGKSTLLKTIAGLHLDYVGGVEIACAYEDFLYFFDTPVMRDDWTVLDGLKFYAEIDNTILSDQLLESLLVQLKLNHIYQHKMSQISLGQLKRIYMARLIFRRDAKVWLLDEPISSLDVMGVKILNHLIEVFLKKGGSVIATGHHDLFQHVTKRIDLKVGAVS